MKEKQLEVTVQNRLVTEKRGINVYHYDTRSTHIISHTSSVTLPLKPIKKNDYLHVTAISGPGDLKNNSLIDLPDWLDFNFKHREEIILTHFGDRIFLKIPPGPSTWELKITRPSGAFKAQQSSPRIIIGEK